MVRKAFTFSLTLTFLFVLLLFAGAAQAGIPLPAIYLGQVKNSAGVNLESGTVKAYVEGGESKEASITDGAYEVFIVGDPEVLKDKPVTFKVNVDGVDYDAVTDPSPVKWQDIISADVTYFTVDLAVDTPSGGSGNSGGSEPGATSEDLNGNQPAGTTPTVIKLSIGQLGITVNNTVHSLDAAPFIDAASSSTLVPLRFISEAFGATVDWVDTTKQIYIKHGDREIVLTIGSREVLVDGVPGTIECPVIVESGVTFVPLRFVSETLGAQLDWDPITQDITITQ